MQQNMKKKTRPSEPRFVYPITLTDNPQEIIDNILLKVEREVKKRTGVKTLTIRSDIYDHSEFTGDIVATVKVRIGKFSGEMEVYRDELVHKGELAKNPSELERKINDYIDVISKKVSALVNAVKELKEEHDLLRKGVSSNNKIVMMTIDLYGDTRDILPIIAPRNMSEQDISNAVKKTIKELDKKQGVWSTADLYDILKKKYKIKFLPVYEDWLIGIW